MRKTPIDSPHRAIGTTVPIQELQAVRTAQGISPTSQQPMVYCTVYYECRRSDSAKHVDQMLGTGVISFPEVNTMLALRSRIVKEVNGRWTEIYSAPLLEEETSLRTPNNYVFPTDNLIMTVAQWYQTYTAPEYRDTHIVLPKHIQRKGKANAKPYAFSVELYINVGQYTARTEDPELIGIGRAGSKRKTSATRATYGDNHDSREAISSPPPRKILRSSFVRDSNLLTQTPQTLSVTEILFKKTTCLIANDSGTPTLLEESSVMTGFLELKTLELSACERGSTKDVFALRIDCNPYVAKKLVNVGNGRSDSIPISTAVNMLTADLVRLKRMAYFAGKFQSAALDQGIEIGEFDVSDGFLIKIYKPGSAPAATPAVDESVLVSEPGTESLDKSPDEVAEVYIVEPLRLTSTVVKFSGTLGTTTRRDLRSLTMAAFAHYVAQETACQYVFADIQGSNNAGNSGKLSLTLFDPMTHTVEGTSGLGDHGFKGIQDFISSHNCNHICQGLDLASSQILQDTLDDLLQDMHDVLQDVEGSASKGVPRTLSPCEEE
ncbi:kinase-like domain-containing protein [Ganoderma leucocontextum]|nr:kinase-like domain-containing protein [Ganoderma leucocontextum]